MSNSNHKLLDLLKAQKGNHLFQRSVVAIEDLEEELSRSRKISEEQKQLIRILKEGKEYYENEYKNNTYQQQFTKLRSQHSQLRILLHAQRQEIQKLNQTVIALQQSNLLKDKNLNQKEQELVSIQIQKQNIEQQWNKVTKAVKRKISKLQQQNHPNPQKKPMISKENETKSRINLSLQQKYVDLKKNSKGNKYLESSLHQRVINTIQMINEKLAISELQKLFDDSQNSNKKEAQNAKQMVNNRKILGESNKQNELQFNLSFY